MARWLLRLRAVLAANLVTVVVVLVALAAVGGWVTYSTYYDPGTTTESRTVGNWQTTARFDHHATVTADNAAFDVGTKLSNRSVYFTTVAPRLNGSFVYTYTATGNADLTETVSLELVTRGVEGGGGVGSDQTEGNVLWSRSDTLEQTTTPATGGSTTVSVPFSIHVPTIENRTRQIESELGGGMGQTEVFVRATVELQGSINGQPVSQTETYALPVAPEGTRYRIEDFGEQTDRHETTRRVAVERTYGPLRRFGGPALLALSVLALGTIGATRRTDRLEPDDDELDRLAFEDERAEFDEWISTIRLPDEAFDRPLAEAESLADLVDFAIDTDNAVVEDPRDGAFYVVHGDFLYRYRPPTASGRLSFGSRGREFDIQPAEPGRSTVHTDGESSDIFRFDTAMDAATATSGDDERPPTAEPDDERPPTAEPDDERPPTAEPDDERPPTTHTDDERPPTAEPDDDLSPTRPPTAEPDDEPPPTADADDEDAETAENDPEETE